MKNIENEKKDSQRNPMHYCFNCNVYLGFRGFCSKKCHDEYYDKRFGSEKSQDYYLGKIVGATEVLTKIPSEKPKEEVKE